MEPTLTFLNSPVFTILHQASRKGDVKIVEYLLANVAKVDTRSFENYTALQYAAELGHYDVIEALSKDEANTDMNAKTGRQEDPTISGVLSQSPQVCGNTFE